MWRHKHIHMINSAERARLKNSDPCEPCPSLGHRASCRWGGARGRSENSSGVNAAAERNINNRELLPVFATASPLLRQPPLSGETAVSHRCARYSPENRKCFFQIGSKTSVPLLFHLQYDASRPIHRTSDTQTHTHSHTSFNKRHHEWAAGKKNVKYWLLLEILTGNKEQRA